MGDSVAGVSSGRPDRAGRRGPASATGRATQASRGHGDRPARGRQGRFPGRGRATFWRCLDRPVPRRPRSRHDPPARLPC